MTSRKKKTIPSSKTGKKKEPKKPICSNCGRHGHNKRSCPIKKDEPVCVGVVIYEPPIPKKGMWIISEKYKRVAGKVSHIKSKTQEVCYETPRGALITSLPHHIRANDYEFVDDLEPYHLLWEKNNR